MSGEPTRISHLDEHNQPRMVDVSNKPVTMRTARARAEVYFPPAVATSLGLDKVVAEGLAEKVTSKGPVFQTAKLAGVMAAKRTHELIPLCHQVPLDSVVVDIRCLGEGRVLVESTCVTSYRTGVEMEALTAATVAALTIYDMCKALSHGIEIRQVVLVAKSGG